ncbi:MAG: hypothetical protein M1829_001583 [Trizodia sp. TS-e1964]|nr:MAG: hypothetical protein M1829_001583 [Trizodia sp. TS-e1964]
MYLYGIISILPLINTALSGQTGSKSPKITSTLTELEIQQDLVNRLSALQAGPNYCLLDCYLHRDLAKLTLALQTIAYPRCITKCTDEWAGVAPQETPQFKQLMQKMTDKCYDEFSKSSDLTPESAAFACWQIRGARATSYLKTHNGAWLQLGKEGNILPNANPAAEACFADTLKLNKFVSPHTVRSRNKANLHIPTAHRLGSVHLLAQAQRHFQNISRQPEYRDVVDIFLGRAVG